MIKWYVKDLSKLTGVSVQTLHHYDRIGLLKPSLRMQNNYRLYLDKDLLRLQQIIALKFFGFELSRIKALLDGKLKANQHFGFQAKLLEQKANNLLEASKTLQTILTDFDDNKSINWKTIIKLIEVYKMTEQLENSWVKEIFSPIELKQYADFETGLKLDEKESFKKNWASLVTEMSKNLQNDPNSAIGINLGKKCMDLINRLYGKKYAHLRTKKFEQGYAEGKGLDEVNLTPEIVSWMDKAIDAYWHDRLYAILAKVGSEDSDIILKNWNEALDDMYGEDNPRKQEIYHIALADENISHQAKAWLRNLCN